MLDTVDLANGLFGYCALGMAVWLFAPAFVQIWKEKPSERDFLQLVALLLTDAAITRLVFYIIVATLETLLLILLCSYAHGFTRKFRSDLHNRRQVEKRLDQEHKKARRRDPSLPKRRLKYQAVGTLLASMHAPYDPSTQPAPVKEQSARKKFIKQAIGVLVVTAVSLGVWFGVDFMRPHTADPNRVSTWPDLPLTWVVYVFGWLGLVCWVAPRAPNIYLSSTKKYPDPIDTSSVVIGAMTDGFNITVRHLFRLVGAQTNRSHPAPLASAEEEDDDERPPSG
ncbi:hypothetical protein JCM1841_005439 [Sporobolomyces salmonicolor]